MDRIDPSRRSKNMRAIRSVNTKPELFVRRLIHRMGFRFRLHRKDLPGKPDLVFPSRHAVIFIHGCFWHQHSNPKCKDGRMPKSNLDFWHPKLLRNQKRDAENIEMLNKMGWRCLTIWECEVKETHTLKQRVKRFLG